MVKSSNHTPTTDRLHFFKILLPGFSTQRLRIPRDFVQHISREAYKFATLEDSTGSRWQVKLSKTIGGTFIEDGWQHFVEDHSLYNNNFLLFGYDGNTCFNVSIFDESACERYYACSVNPNQEHALSSGATKSHASSEICTDCVQKTSKDDSGSSSRRPATATTRISAAEEEIKTVWKEAESFTSKFPYFSRCLTATDVGSYLYIPMDFVRKHINIQEKRKVTLGNRKGQAWEVTISFTRKGTTLSAGWKAFVRGNKLEETDVCIFELLGQSEMQVHIFQPAVTKGKFAVEE